MMNATFVIILFRYCLTANKQFGFDSDSSDSTNNEFSALDSDESMKLTQAHQQGGSKISLQLQVKVHIIYRLYLSNAGYSSIYCYMKGLPTASKERIYGLRTKPPK